MDLWRPPGFTEEKMQRLRLKAPADVVEDYFHLFVNRRAYTSSPTGRTRKVAGTTTTGPPIRQPARGSA